MISPLKQSKLLIFRFQKEVKNFQPYVFDNILGCEFLSLTCECFENAVKISPDEGHLKYMNLGQLLEGQEAVDAYNKGIQLMLANKDATQVCLLSSYRVL